MTAVDRKYPTSSLLWCGVLVGPLYVAVSLAQALTREGFDLTRHPWSLLANGDLGWIQIANFLVSGSLLVAFAVGLRRALAGGRVGTAAPWLLAVFGLSMIAAGVFRADPAMGFPVGTPDGPTPVSGHGMAHFAAGGIGFLCLAAACVAIGRRYAAEGRRSWALFSQATGIAFLAGFAMIASGGGAAATLAFTAAILWVFTWLTVIAYERVQRKAG